MTTLSVEFPDDVFVSVRKSPSEVARESKLAVSIRWYQQGLISQEKAAYLAGVSRWAFLDVLAREQRDVFVVDVDSVKRELEGV
jgi:predicted HTH domain antitoxin